MIVQSEVVTQADFGAAVDALERKKPNPANALLRLESFTEGPSVQIMHVGRTPPSLARWRNWKLSPRPTAGAWPDCITKSTWATRWRADRQSSGPSCATR